jgi:hypothetical protein
MNNLIEQQLFAHRGDLFNDLDLVFVDTRSLYFESLSGRASGSMASAGITGRICAE